MRGVGVESEAAGGLEGGRPDLGERVDGARGARGDASSAFPEVSPASCGGRLSLCAVFSPSLWRVGGCHRPCGVSLWEVGGCHPPRGVSLWGVGAVPGSTTVTVPVGCPCGEWGAVPESSTVTVPVGCPCGEWEAVPESTTVTVPVGCPCGEWGGCHHPCAVWRGLSPSPVLPSSLWGIPESSTVTIPVGCPFGEWGVIMWGMEATVPQCGAVTAPIGCGAVLESRVSPPSVDAGGCPPVHSVKLGGCMVLCGEHALH